MFLHFLLCPDAHVATRANTRTMRIDLVFMIGIDKDRYDMFGVVSFVVFRNKIIMAITKRVVNAESLQSSSA